MESSRDDFVIAIRSAFLKKQNKQRFSLIGLIFFSIIFLVLGRLNFVGINYTKIFIKEIVYRSSFIVSIPENYIKKTYMTVKSHFDLYEEYIVIKKDLKKLKSEKKIDKFIISENVRLKRIVNDYVVDTNQILAKVLIDKQSPFLKSVVINKGSRENLKLGMAILDGNYLVGKIVEVNYLTSRVLLISDLNSKIPVIIEPGSIQSILSGTGKNHGVIQYQKEKKKIQEENTVYTSGSGGIFKAGIPVGVIKKNLMNTSIDSEAIILEKRVTFFSDFSQLGFINVLEFQEESN